MPLKKTSRKSFLIEYPDFPTSNNSKDIYTYPDYYRKYIMYVEAKSTKGLCGNVAKEFTKLMELLNCPQLHFLGNSTTPWLFREHDYKPVLQALNYLTENNISKSFNGAITTTNLNLTDFLKHLFWLVRCNGVVFYPYFTDVQFNIMGTICQYGNIHLSTLSEEVDALFNEKVQQTKFILTDKSKCTGRIFKRKTSAI
jgi:hypothetical protein